MRRLVACVAAAAILVVGNAYPCAACSCAAQTKKQIGRGADVVFTGVVTDVEIEQSDDFLIGDEKMRAHFAVHKAYKGRVGFTATVNAGQTGNSCSFRFEEGATYTVFADRRRDGSLSTHICAGTRRGEINPTRYGLRIKWLGDGGAAARDLTGAALANIGDYNSDGRPDALIGAPFADSGRREDAGAAFVAFGHDEIATTDLRDYDFDAFRINGARRNDLAGFDVADAGDVNGDGQTDLLIGAPGADANGVDSGAAYVIFDLPEPPAPFRLGALEDHGFVIRGAAPNVRAGTSVAGAGDVNQDGFPDLIVTAGPGGASGSGPSDGVYVVFGKANAEPVELSRIEQDGTGYRIFSGEADDFGRALANAGDVNGDAVPDAIVGAPGAAPGGAAYVVFGQSSTASVDVRAPAGRGFRINGAEPNDATGWSVAGASDMNGDSFADVLVGAPVFSESNAVEGAAYVVFGGAETSDVDLGTLGGRGIRMVGARGDRAGWSVGSLGDVNGDATPEALIGAPALIPSEDRRGRVYVVFGSSQPGTVGLADLDGLGFRVVRGRRGGAFGYSVADASDVNADGFSDVLGGAPFQHYRGRFKAGRVYIEF
jgi:hypothetical protein